MWTITGQTGKALNATSRTLAEIGAELGVEFVLEGSVRRAKNRVRITAQLIDAFPLLRGYRRLIVRHIPEADHSFLRRATREALIDVLVDWVLGIR